MASVVYERGLYINKMNFYAEMYAEFDRRFVRNGKLFNDDPLPIKVFIDDLFKFQANVPPPPKTIIKEVPTATLCPPCPREHSTGGIPQKVIDEISRLEPRAKHDMETQDSYSKRIEQFNAQRDRVLKILHNYKP